MSTMRIRSAVDGPLVVAGQEPEQHAADERDRDGDDADLERHLRPVDDAGEGVAAELVGAHRVGPARILEAEVDDRVRVEPPDLRPEHGDEQVEEDDARRRPSRSGCATCRACRGGAAARDVHVSTRRSVGPPSGTSGAS